MKEYKKRFIALSEQVSALKFGQFTLKSGRVSPYFFNAGHFCTGHSLWKVAECYADKIIEDGLEFDVIFGPAYKGIPLVAAISVILSQRTGQQIPWVFNRKEVKDHGEGGMLVGSSLEGKVLIIDDVITAGTAIRQSIQMIVESGASIASILVALDRQEVANEGGLSAIQRIEKDFTIKTSSVIELSDLVQYVSEDESMKSNFEALQSYRKQYGV